MGEFLYHIAKSTYPLFNKYTGIYPWSVPISATLFPFVTKLAIFNNLSVNFNFIHPFLIKL